MNPSLFIDHTLQGFCLQVEASETLFPAECLAESLAAAAAAAEGFKLKSDPDTEAKLQLPTRHQQGV